SKSVEASRSQRTGRSDHGGGALTNQSPLVLLGLFLIGVIAAVFGAIAGLGGGFLIVPVLRLFFSIDPAFAAADSLLFVFANTLAASVTFLRRRTVDLKRGAVIAAAGVPGSIFGAYVVRLMTGRSFDLIYGIFLVAVAITIVARRNATPQPRSLSPVNMILAEIGIGIFVGFASSFFGIGGGIVLVPVMLVLFREDVHVTAATSAFVVMLTSPVGVIAHGAYGDLNLWTALPLVAGGLTGGAIGARVARHLHAKHLSNVMAGMLFVAALALAIKHL
ncbi:MAG: sulfite exporter TauE/SafE family protein, partial [Vulcanimicrobiaceae bacterium]